MNRSTLLALILGAVLGAAGWSALAGVREGLPWGERSQAPDTYPPRTAVLPAGAPAPIGPYSPAVRSGDLLFLSGQIGLDPASGRMVAGGIIPETRQVLANLAALLEAAGLNFDDVLRATVYLVDLEDYGAFNEEYAKVFGEVPPARVAVQVSRLPRDARVEVSMIARGPSR